jgi:hypothetical protein
MKPPCLVITGIKSNGEKFRPATPTPDKHWAFHFTDAMMKWDCHFKGKLPHRGTLPDGIRVAMREEGIVVEVHEEFGAESPEGMAQLMDLVKAYGLEYRLDSVTRCIHCKTQHQDCVGYVPRDELGGESEVCGRARFNGYLYGETDRE